MERLNADYRLSRGLDIARFLNEEGKGPARTMLLEVFKRCLELDALRRGLKESTTAEQVNAITPRQGAVVNELNRILLKLQFVPHLMPHFDGYDILWTGRLGQDEEPGTIPAANFIKRVLEMTEAGTLERVRQCFCGRWFLARTAKKTACSDSCRFQKFKRSHHQEFKEERAAYMRDYRNNPKVKAGKKGLKDAKTQARKR